VTDSVAAAAAPLVPEGVSGLDLPLGRRIELPGRGTTFVRLADGPSRDAPTVLLLHGWVASGGLNWYQAFGPLSRHFNVIAPDLRGHGRGIRTWRRFRLSDCADDCAALLDELDVGPVIACGYSMGGPVAQLLWQRHRDHVGGLVLGATSASFIPGVQQRMMFVGMMAVAAGTTRTSQLFTRLPGGRRIPVVARASGRRPDSIRRWAPAEMRRHDMRMVFEAGNAIATFSSRRWIGDVDVPTTVLVTTKDRAVDPTQQMKLALRIPRAELLRYEEGHTSPVLESFGTAVTDACLSVARRL
jgi:pimeloyl-ACP methyl ester carboxylesterase